MAREWSAVGDGDPRERHVHLWRRQLFLVCLSALAFVVAIGLLFLTLGLAANREAEVARANPESWQIHTGITLLSWQMWPALLGLAALATVLTLSVVHAVRVAAFALRKGDDL